MMAEGEGSLPPPVAAQKSLGLTSEEARKEAVVSKFASLLNAKVNNPGTLARSTVKEAIKCLSPSVAGHDVVCTLPSLDIQSEGTSSPLPEVGKHREKTTVPEMKASLFDRAITESAKSAREEERTAKMLGALTSWTKSSLVYAPDATAKNVSASFQALVDSRVRAWTLLLLKNSLSTGDSTSRSRLLGMLSCMIQAKEASISFTTLSLPDSARGQPKDADVILPLLFQAELQLTLQERTETVSFQAPGTISGVLRLSSRPIRDPS